MRKVIARWGITKLLFCIAMLIIGGATPSHAAAGKCGTKEILHLGLIFGGNVTTPGQWPWHAAIFTGVHPDELTEYICGGTIISPNFIVTAAHCTMMASAGTDAELYVLWLGLHELYGNDHNAVNYTVSDVIVYENFKRNTLQNDIALFRTTDDIQYTDYIRPICLWPVEKKSQSNVVGTNGIVVGWGLSDGYKLQQKLLQATLPVVSYETCIASYPEHFNKVLLRDANYCAGDRSQVNVCSGDSGGGMYIQIDKVWYLRGIVSVGAMLDDPNGKSRCDPRHYSTFTDVPHYLQWIIKHQNAVRQRNLLNLPDCGWDSVQTTVPEQSKPIFGQYPWTVVVEYLQEKSLKTIPLCNGALIHKRFVLTVAHCVTGVLRGYSLKSVRLGDYNLNTNPDVVDNKSTTVQIVDIEKILRHPKFDEPQYAYDVALLLLKNDADVSKPNIAPICLATLDDYSEVEFVISGWKRVGPLARTMTRSSVEQMNVNDCQQLFLKRKIKIKLPEDSTCAILYNATKTDCTHYRAGVPLQYVKISERKRRYFLRGVLTLNFPACEPDLADVFVDVRKISSWINEAVGSNSS